MVIRNEKWDIVVRTSMNLNENPRLENIEISENRKFAEFFQTVADEIFKEVGVGEKKSQMLDLFDIDENSPYKEVESSKIKTENTNEVKVTHVVSSQKRD